MHTLLRQTSLIISKPPNVQATLEHHLLKHKTSNTAKILTKEKKHYSSIICQSKTHTDAVAITPGDNDIEDQYESLGLRREWMPNHVAVILDGTRRWSKANGKPVNYQPFFQANTLFADLCLRWGIGTATTYIYSLKNLLRGYEANELLFRQLQKYLDDNFDDIKRKGIKLWMIGEKSALPEYLRHTIEKVEEGTKNNTKLELMFALCYGGTDEMVKATRSICQKVKEGVIDPEDVNDELFEKELWTGPSRAPNPDLLIRTGGRVRVSNYLIWQLAQTELYFCDTYAPDFKEADFIDALKSYQQRERTFGE
ncbi:hypothetical protein RND81_13G084600 [Saponaria officinalis]|uniref:Alkyl transferase n=1 Tax=Saponaria officinalis TaxID=3572 RepID=A0AAW1GYI0_SAPOF